eukprot:s5079_g1.t1
MGASSTTLSACAFCSFCCFACRSPRAACAHELLESGLDTPVARRLLGSYWNSAAERRDVKVAAYIVATDQAGVQVNQQDTLWDRCSFIFGTTCNNCTALHYSSMSQVIDTCSCVTIQELL